MSNSRENNVWPMDNLETLAGNVISFAALQENQSKLISIIQEARSRYLEPTQYLLSGYIYQCYRTRGDEFDQLEKNFEEINKLDDKLYAEKSIDLICKFFETGAWHENSANALLLLGFIKHLKYYDATKKLSPDASKRFQTLTKEQKPDFIAYEKEKKIRHNEMQRCFKNNKLQPKMPSTLFEIKKFYSPPERRSIDANENLKKVKIALTQSLFKKTYEVPVKRKIEENENLKGGATAKILLTKLLRDRFIANVYKRKPKPFDASMNSLMKDLDKNLSIKFFDITQSSEIADASRPSINYNNDHVKEIKSKLRAVNETKHLGFKQQITIFNGQQIKIFNCYNPEQQQQREEEISCTV